MKNNLRLATKGLSDLNLLRKEAHGDIGKRYSKSWFITLILAIIMAGCNGWKEDMLPTVSSTIPASGATIVAVNTPITVTFSSAMDPATITTTNFTVTAGATSVTGTVALSADGLTATFTPTNPLSASTRYTATITTGVKDLNGNAMAANEVWSFSTGPAPTVISTVPPNLATGVAVNTPITVTFSSATDPATITTANFTVTAGAISVTGTVALSTDGLTATFTPTNPLSAGALYTATISGVKDLAGNAMVSDASWSFTTQ